MREKKPSRWGWEASPYHEKLNKGQAKCGNDVVDLGIQLIGSHEGPPAGEDGVCDFQDAYVDLGVGGGELVDEFLYNARQGSAWPNLGAMGEGGALPG